MIVGPSHLTLTSSNIVRDGSTLESSGYREIFSDIGLPNHPNKSRFLRSGTDRHSIEYFKPPQGLPIELIQYQNELGDHRSPVQVVAELPLTVGRQIHDSTGLEEILQTAFGCESIDKLELADFNAFMWHSRDVSNSYGSGIQTIIIPVVNIDAACVFWTHGFGFREVNRGTTENRAWSRLQFTGPLRSWMLGLVLWECAYEPFALDDTGFTCVAFISTSLKNDVQKLLACGGKDHSGQFELCVNGRSLLIDIVVGPGGEYIELLELVSHTKQ